MQTIVIKYKIDIDLNLIARSDDILSRINWRHYLFKIFQSSVLENV